MLFLLSRCAALITGQSRRRRRIAPPAGKTSFLSSSWRLGTPEGTAPGHSSTLWPRNVIPGPRPHLQSAPVHRHLDLVIPRVIRSAGYVAHRILRVQLASNFINRIFYRVILERGDMLPARRCRRHLQRMIRILFLPPSHPPPPTTPPV